MTKELEERLAKLEKELRVTKPNHSDNIKDRPISSSLTPAKKLSVRKITVLAIILSTALLAALIFAWFVAKNPSPIPKKIKEAANFSLYYPDGIQVDEKSVTLSNGNNLLTYTINYNGKRVYATIQPKVDYLDIDSFQKNFKHSIPVATEYGSGVVGELAGRTIGNLVTKDSWVLLSTDSKQARETVVQILESLREDKD